MDEVFALYERLGVKGVKVDFMDRDDQEMVAFYHRMLSSAARHKLMVNLHGAYHPTGLNRTWPNFMTQEGVLGAEYNKWSRRVTATHNVTLPFTRMLIGPMDYTPGGFRNATPDDFQVRFFGPQVMTTRAHQLATLVVYESPLQVIADSPDAYQSGEGSAFIADVPATWDETRALAGEVGEYIVLARRSGKRWFIGAMTNEQPRQLEIALDFLGGGQFVAETYADGNAPTDVGRSASTVAANASLTLDLAGSGGAAIMLTPAGGAGR